MVATAIWLNVDWDSIPVGSDGKPEPFWMHVQRERDVIHVEPKPNPWDGLRNSQPSQHAGLMQAAAQQSLAMGFGLNSSHFYQRLLYDHRHF